jgi:hypothetical protein
MKIIIPYCLAAVFAVAATAQLVRNRALRDDLASARAELAAAKAAQRATPKPPAPAVVAAPEPRQRQAEAAPAPLPEFDEAEFDKAVEERVEERVKERDEARRAEREARRRAWENETDEQREARRQEFQARMKEHAAQRLAEFAEKAALDETQQTALEGELQHLSLRVREIADGFAAALDEGAPFGFETQMQMVNEISTAVLDAYAGLDASLPEGWREHDDGVIMFWVGPDAGEAFGRAMRRPGGFRPGGFGGFPGGGPPRQPR